ncbi:MAG: glycoside hydrolase family 3 C-terminal domain-containing protein [Bacilli bacterium]|jgi:beta-glucosidase
MRIKQKSVVKIAVLAVISLIGFQNSSFSENLVNLGANKKESFHTDYDTYSECLTEAGVLNQEVAEEGTILLKNDGTLPFNGNERVSVFGVRSDSIVGGSATGGAFDMGAAVDTESVPQSLRKAGFKVNPTLENLYKKDSSAIGSEITEFSGSVKSSLSLYSDAAFVVLSRAGGEGSDQSTVTNETVGNDDTHKALLTKTVKGKDGSTSTNTYKHSLMLTDSEEELISFVKSSGFKHIVIVLNTSNALEVDKLDKDPQINAIVDISRPGKSGIFALGEILNGEVNPSGRLQDTWDVDHTADPTWCNFGDNSQVGTNAAMLDPEHRIKETTGGGGFMPANDGQEKTPDDYPYDTSFDNAKSYSGGTFSEGYYSIDYEEGIYTGYKYYETKYADMYDANATEGEEWFTDNVTYPYGYGLSYSTFSMNIMGVYTDDSNSNQLTDGTTINSADLSNNVNVKANIDKMYVKVRVTNTGGVKGKQTVQLYAHAPYTSGSLEKAEHTLVGFGKTDMLAPGQCQDITIKINVQDMASWDTNYNGGAYTLEKGKYILRAMDSSHFDRRTNLTDTTDAYDQFSFNLASDAHMLADDFSLAKVSNQFTGNGDYDNSSTDFEYNFNSVRTKDMMADGTSAMTIMSRSDFNGTFPTAPTTGDRTFKKNWYSNQVYLQSFDQDEGYKDKETDPWYIDNSAIPSSWTQSTDDTTTTPIQFKDMEGIDFEGTTAITSSNSAINGKTGTKAWNAFMNQLTWDQVAKVVEYGGYGSPELANVGKAADLETDGPTNVDGSFQWCDEPLLTSTFNTKLVEEVGTVIGDICMFKNVTGWYGPGMDCHRSAFSGRNFEYYSQDGYAAGAMAAAEIKGAQSKGIVAYAKHFAFNDQETNRGADFEFMDEQTIRETELKAFQMAFQEGGSKASMVGYGHIAGIPNTNNYNLLTNIAKKEWNWKGTFDTDGYIGWIDITSPDLMNRAGCEIELRTPPWYETPSGTWDASLRNNKGGVKVKTGTNGALEESPNQYYYTRTSATRLLYNRANSINNQNGYYNLEYKVTNLAATQYEKAVGLDAGIATSSLNADSSVIYSLTKGTLPEGLTLNTATGQITGTAITDGTFDLSIQAVIDGYITKNANFTLTVSPAFTLDADGDDVNEAKVGEEFVTKINSTVFTTDGGKYDSVTYSVAFGNLPAGLAIADDGTISGTPTTAGTYNAVIGIKTKKTTSNFMGSQTTEANYTYNIAFSVKGTPAPVVEQKYTVTFNTNGGTTVASQSVKAGEMAIVPSVPTKEGYTFTGWYLDNACSAMASFQVGITSDVTYYAGWTKNATTDTDNTSNGNNKGCGGSIITVSSIAAAIALLGTGLAIKKRKDSKK